MKIIPPYQISSEILNIVNEATDYIILVSPYVDFTNWERIKSDLRNAQSRNVKIIFYTRLEDKNFKSWEQIEELGIKPFLVKNLHAKLYFNEKTGVVTSMNLLTSSNLNAIEFGTLIDSHSELDELKKYVKKYLDPNATKEKPDDEDLYLAKEKFKVILENCLSNTLNRNVSCKQDSNGISFNAESTFYATIDRVNNKMFLGVIVSGLEKDNFEKFKSSSQLKFAEIFLESGGNDYYSKFNLQASKRYSNSNFDLLLISEKKEILNIISTFTTEIVEFKNQLNKK